MLQSNGRAMAGHSVGAGAAMGTSVPLACYTLEITSGAVHSKMTRPA